MKNKLIKYSTLSVVIMSCLSFTACGEDEIVEPVIEISTEIESESEIIKKSIPETETESETVTETETTTETSEAEAEMPEATTSTIEIVEELDTTMYGIKNGNIRSGDSTDYEKVASLEYGATIHVTGKTANGWYRIQWGDTDAYCASSLLATSMPSDSGNTSEVPQQPTQPEKPTQPSTPPSSGGGNNNGGSVPGTNLPQPSQNWTNSDLFG